MSDISLRYLFSNFKTKSRVLHYPEDKDLIEQFNSNLKPSKTPKELRCKRRGAKRTEKLEEIHNKSTEELCEIYNYVLTTRQLSDGTIKEYVARHRRPQSKHQPKLFDLLTYLVNLFNKNPQKNFETLPKESKEESKEDSKLLSKEQIKERINEIIKIYQIDTDKYYDEIQFLYLILDSIDNDIELFKNLHSKFQHISSLINDVNSYKDKPKPYNGYINDKCYEIEKLLDDELIPTKYHFKSLPIRNYIIRTRF